MDEVIVINYTGRRGGGNLDAFEMSNALVDLGLKVVPIISSDIDNIDIWRKVGFERLLEVDTYKSKISFVINTLLFGIKTKRKIKKEMMGYKIKAVYCPMETLWTDKINAVFRDAKTIMVIHDPSLHSGTKWYFKLWNHRKKYYDAVIVHSRAFVDEVQKSGICKNVFYIPLGRHNLYRNIENKKTIITYDSNLVNFVFFGRIEKYKGLDILAEAWKKIDREFHSKVSLAIIGNGDFSDYQRLYEPFSNVTVIYRWIDDSEVESIFTGDNLVCVCPYKDATQSGVILVAMDYGVPSIASDVGGIGEQVINGETGILVNPGKVDELVFGMKQFILNDKLRDRMKNGIEKYLDSISWGRLAIMLKKILDTAI